MIAPADFEALLAHVRSRFTVEPDCEIAVEIDPRTWPPMRLRPWRGRESTVPAWACRISTRPSRAPSTAFSPTP